MAMFCSCCAASENVGFEEEDPAPEAVMKSPVPEPTETEPAEASVTFSFELPEGGVKDIVVFSKPLGLDFYKSIPFTVKRVKPDCGKEVADVQPQWVLKEVGGEPMKDDLKDAMAQLVKAVRHLPQRK
eukprot:g31761.t1